MRLIQWYSKCLKKCGIPVGVYLSLRLLLNNFTTGRTGVINATS